MFLCDMVIMFMTVWRFYSKTTNQPYPMLLQWNQLLQAFYKCMFTKSEIFRRYTEFITHLDVLSCRCGCWNNICYTRTYLLLTVQQNSRVFLYHAIWCRAIEWRNIFVKFLLYMQSVPRLTQHCSHNIPRQHYICHISKSPEKAHDA